MPPDLVPDYEYTVYNYLRIQYSAKSAVALLVHDRVLSMSRQGVLNIDKGDRDAAM